MGVPVRRNLPTKIGWALHKALYRASGGRIGGRLALPVLLLKTTGRKSGRERVNALYYLSDGDSYVVIASNAGEGTHPAWYLNLTANPRATVQIKRDTFEAIGRVATGEERERLWRQAVEADDAYEVYQSRTPREIPVVVLERAAA